MATLLFGLAGVLALFSFTMLPDAPSLGSIGSLGSLGSLGGGGHVVTDHPAEGEDPSINANRGLEAARARRSLVTLDSGPGPVLAVAATDPGAAPPPGELPTSGQVTVPQQPAGATPPAAQHAPPVQSAPQVSFVPGQPMIDTNPSR